MGRVGTAHGLRGEVTVEVLSDNPLRFARGSELVHRGADGKTRRLVVTSSKQHGKRTVVVFEGVSDRDTALTLRNGRLEVENFESSVPPEGQYYYYQLVGCRCIDQQAGDLGVVEEVLEDGGGEILRVVDGDREVLIPFVDPFLVHIDTDQQLIELNLPDGLIETCGSK